MLYVIILLVMKFWFLLLLARAFYNEGFSDFSFIVLKQVGPHIRMMLKSCTCSTSPNMCYPCVWLECCHTWRRVWVWSVVPHQKVNRPCMCLQGVGSLPLLPIGFRVPSNLSPSYMCLDWVLTHVTACVSMLRVVPHQKVNGPCMCL